MSTTKRQKAPRKTQAHLAHLPTLGGRRHVGALAVPTRPPGSPRPRDGAGDALTWPHRPHPRHSPAAPQEHQSGTGPSSSQGHAVLIGALTPHAIPIPTLPARFWSTLVTCDQPVPPAGLPGGDRRGPGPAPPCASPALPAELSAPPQQQRGSRARSGKHEGQQFHRPRKIHRVWGE